MRTKTTMLILILLGVMWSREAQAFYNPSTGRWLTRDPIEDPGFALSTADDSVQKDDGANHYQFVANSPVNGIDQLGLYRLFGRHKIFVDPCEIVLLYGHGSQPPRNWKWWFKRGGCNAGAAITCWPGLNSSGIPDELNLWTQWQGVPADNNMLIQWGMGRNGPPWFYLFNNPLQRRANANMVLWETFIKAVRRSVDICRSCPECKKVRISFVQVDRNGERINPVRQYGGIPPMGDVTIPCNLKICRPQK